MYRISSKSISKNMLYLLGITKLVTYSRGGVYSTLYFYIFFYNFQLSLPRQTLFSLMLNGL